jgi:hypothetical protein
LIRRISSDNPGWGEDRISLELKAKLGVEHAPSTIRRYMVAGEEDERPASSTWRSFLAGHAIRVMDHGPDLSAVVGLFGEVCLGTHGATEPEDSSRGGDGIADPSLAQAGYCQLELILAQIDIRPRRKTTEYPHSPSRGSRGLPQISLKVTIPSDPLSRHQARNWWKKAEALAELKPKRGRGWHSLRRKFASDLMHKPLKVLSELGGWKNPQTILICYQHPDQEQLREALLDRRRVVVQK